MNITDRALLATMPGNSIDLVREHADQQQVVVDVDVESGGYSDRRGLTVDGDYRLVLLQKRETLTAL